LFQNQDEILYLPRHRFHQRQLFSGQRWIGADHDQRRIDVRDECLRCRCVPSEYRSEAGSIHEAHATGQ